MRWILARHGNTFEKGTPVTMTGGAQDPPLTNAGIEQAKAFGTWLKKNNIDPKGVHSSPLRRTSEFARVALENAQLKLPIRTEEVLREINYGTWTGKTDEELKKEFGVEEWVAWQKKSLWPKNGHWQPNEVDIVKSIDQFSRGLQKNYDSKASVIIVSSSGILRYFLKLIPGEWQRRIDSQTFKMSPGRFGEFEIERGKISCRTWNQDPLI